MAADLATWPTRQRSPFEPGLDWLVDFDKGYFIGRRTLPRERETGPRYCLVGLDIEGRKPATDALIYHGRSTQVGMVTSAMRSQTTKRNIALATLDAAFAEKVDSLWAEFYVNKELKWGEGRRPLPYRRAALFRPAARSADATSGLLTGN